MTTHDEYFQLYKIQLEKMLGEGHKFTLELNPFEAVCLVGFLQLTLRGIVDEEHLSAQPVRELLTKIIHWADEVSPQMAGILRMGNDPRHDVVSGGGTLLENAVHVYIKDSTDDSPPLLCFGRPQDFSFPHWHYHRLHYQIGTDFVSIIHAYVDVEMEKADALAFFAPMATQLPLPNPYERRRPLTPTDPLLEDDFWHPSAGPQPPFVDEVWEEWQV